MRPNGGRSIGFSLQQSPISAAISKPKPKHFVRNGCWGWDGARYRVPPAGSLAGWAEPPPDEIAEAGNWAFYTARDIATFAASFEFRMLAPSAAGGTVV